MEQSCESARLAVNAILDQLVYADTTSSYNAIGSFLGDYCEIFDPEQYEPMELAAFKDLDRALFKRDIPHMLDVLQIPQTIDKMSKRENPTDTPLYNLSTLMEEGFEQHLRNTEVFRHFANQTNLSSTDQVISNIRQVAAFAEEALALISEHMPSRGGSGENSRE